jgi:hypothetical protein
MLISKELNCYISINRIIKLIFIKELMDIPIFASLSAPKMGLFVLDTILGSSGKVRL